MDAKEWYGRNDDERQEFLQNSAKDYKDLKEKTARRVKRNSTKEKLNVLDPKTGEMLRLTVDEANRLTQKYQKEETERQKMTNEQRNLNFIQLQKGTAPEIIAKIVTVSPVAVQVLMFFFKNMSKDGVLAVSQQTIAETLGKSRQAVNSAIKVLEEHHAVARGKIGGSAVVYIVNPDIAWQQTHVKKKIMYLNGVMMLSKSENERIFDEFEKLQTANLSSLSINTGTVRVARNQNSKNLSVVKNDEPTLEEYEEQMEASMFGDFVPDDEPPDNY